MSNTDLRHRKPDVQPRAIPNDVNPKVTVPEVVEYSKKLEKGSVLRGLIKPSQNASSNPNLIKIGTPEYVVVCGLAGVLVAGGSHLLGTPLDVIKCRIQTNATKFPNFGTALRTTLAEEGIRGLCRGWAPTLIGYGAQGFAKFGFYEVFKKQYADMLGPQFAAQHKIAIYLAASATAEAIGDIALAPFEAVKVRVQTSNTVPSSLHKALPFIYSREGFGGLFKGLPPLWMRQIPYTASKFVCFEACIETIYKDILKKQRHEVSGRDQLAVSLVSSVISGIVCAICSHPPDVVVSKLYKDPNAKLWEVTKQLGFRGLWSGLAARILMIGSIATMQLFVVDSVKTAFNLERPKQ
uniref:Phosphate carrier protein, mitochondrial n=1 Tax=Panagrellus redivivus TaxID=6233 RepID=A0A7E4VQ25_PANRE